MISENVLHESGLNISNEDFNNGTAISKMERINNMSFNCVYMNDDYIILGSDSRESFSTEFYINTRQKTFVNKEQKLIWSMTGMTKDLDIDYFELVNNIMNTSSTIQNKIYLIQHILKYPTKTAYERTGVNQIFDLLIGSIENDKLTTYTIEVKNGDCLDQFNQRYTKYLNPISSGVHTEFRELLDLEIMNNSNKVDSVAELTKLIQQVIRYDNNKTQTVGGDVYVAYMDKSGNITTYINGEEVYF